MRTQNKLQACSVVIIVELCVEFTDVSHLTLLTSMTDKIWSDLDVKLVTFALSIAYKSVSIVIKTEKLTSRGCKHTTSILKLFLDPIQASTKRIKTMVGLIHRFWITFIRNFTTFEH